MRDPITPFPRASARKLEDQRHDPADDEAGQDRGIEAELSALDHDVAGQPAEAEPAEPWPQHPQQ